MMKPQINILLTVVIIGLSVYGTHAYGQEKKVHYNEQWPVNNVQTLQIDNRFGEVKVTDKGGSHVTIDVVVTVEASSERRANELLALIDVKFSKSGSTVMAKTELDRIFNSKNRFSIDYEVNVPPDKNLHIANKYGNTFVNELTANGIFDIQYGHLNINKLNTNADKKVEINLAYGKSDIIEARDVTAIIRYSTINFGKLKDLTLDSRYTVINIEQGGNISAESRYDTFNFGIIGSIKADTKYTQIKVDELIDLINLENGYGSIKVGKVSNKFDEVSINNSYGQISIGLANSEYMLDANCSYCGISFPQNSFTGEKLKESQTQIVRGRIGSGKGGFVKIRSRYGQIRLN